MTHGVYETCVVGSPLAPRIDNMLIVQCNH